MFRWTTCVRLDHLRAVGPPGSRNTVVQRNISGPTAFKWSKQSGRVTTCETLSHHAGRSASGMKWSAGTAPRRMRSAPFSPRCPPRSQEQRSEPPSRERNTLPMPRGARGQTPRPARTSRPLAHSGAPGYAGCRNPRGRAPGGRSRGPRPIAGVLVMVVVRLAAPLPGPAAARAVQICCKGPD